MIRVQEAHLNVAADTHEGMKGKNNEDSFAVSAFQLSEKNPVPILLGVLSDGIGGHRAGEVASSIAVNVISERISKSDGNQPVHTLKEAIRHANSEIFAQSQDGQRQGMGATISVVYIINNQLYTATIGDSRIYLIRDNSIRQVSTDHTWIQEALEAGLITPEQAVSHPNAHVIRRYLGGPKAPDVDTRLKLNGTETDIEAEANQGTILKPGDFTLQCSDGLTDLVQDSEILDIVTNNPLEQAVQLLIDTANERGGHDNITIIITQVPEDFKAQPQIATTTKSSAIWMGCLGLFILVALILAGLWFFVLQPARQSQFISNIDTNPTAFPVNVPAVTITDAPPTETATILPATEEIIPTATQIQITNTAEPTLPAPQHDDYVSSLSWNQSGSYLASASTDSSILIWDTGDGSLYSTMASRSNPGNIPAGINSIAWNPNDSTQIASGASDGTITIWQIGENQPVLEPISIDASISSIAWKPDGTWLAAGYIDGSVLIWDTVTGNRVRFQRGEGVSIQSVAWKPDGTQLALAYGNGSVIVWDTISWDKLPDMARPSVSANRLAWSTDGNRLVCGYSDGNITILNIDISGDSDPLPTSHENAVIALAWKPNNNQFASGSTDGKIVIWDAALKKSLSILQNPGNSVTALAWDADGRQLASGSINGTVIIWDVENKTPAENTPRLPDNDEQPSSQPGSNAPSQGQALTTTSTP